LACSGRYKRKRGCKAKMNKFSIMALAGLFLISLSLGHDAHAQNVTLYQESLDEMGIFLQTNTLNAAWPIILMLGFVASALVAIRMRKSTEYGMVFALMASIFALVLSFVFLTPYDYAIITETTSIIINDDNGTAAATLDKTKDVTIIFSKDAQFRFILTTMFMVLSLLFGMLSILILVEYRKK
jgi:hypothetical protein